MGFVPANRYMYTIYVTISPGSRKSLLVMCRLVVVLYVVPFSSYLTLNNRDLEIWVRGH